MKKIAVIGGGPAGMMAAVKAAEKATEVILIEKMPSPGRKLLITGKGRCNLTNTGDRETFFNNINSNPKFLYSAFDTFDNSALISFMEKRGVKIKEERGGRVFPESDRSQDVLEAFIKHLKSKNVKIQTGIRAKRILAEEGMVKGINTDEGDVLADAVILTTGGASYPGTGSMGEGYKMARDIGHSIVPLKPGLVPLETKERWVEGVQGLTLKNVKLEAYSNNILLGSQFGEMLFTHFGVSGPIVLSLSNKIVDSLQRGKGVKLIINLKPALSLEQMDRRIQRDFEKNSRKQFKNSLDELLPKSLIPVVIEQCNISEEKQVNQITRQERINLASILLGLTLTIKKSRSIKEAIVTRGGVNVKEVNPRTMESKIVKGLYFAGEVLDIDAYTGGFNLQCAFSTGYVAGISAVI